MAYFPTQKFKPFVFKKKKSLIMINSKSSISKNLLHKGGAVLEERVRTYVIHLLGTYVTILCIWLII